MVIVAVLGAYLIVAFIFYCWIARSSRAAPEDRQVTFHAKVAPKETSAEQRPVSGAKRTHR